MPVYWKGTLYITPTTASFVDDTALANTNPTIGNVLALVGECEGGIPGQPLDFGNPDDAVRALREGDLMLAVKKAFSASPQTNAPRRVVAIRANPGTQSSLTLKSSSGADTLLLKSKGYGPWTNRIRVKIDNGSVGGKRVSTEIDGVEAKRDNLDSKLCTVQYLGNQASATLVVQNTTVELQAPTGTTVFSVNLAAFDTVQKLVDVINTVSGWSATAQNPFLRHPTLNALDGGSFPAKSAPVTVKGDGYAVQQFLQSLDLFEVSRVPATFNEAPANIGYTALAGATGGATTFQHWAQAIQALGTRDCQWIAALSPDAAVHSMVEAHISFQSGLGKERRAFAGGPSGLSRAEAISRARALNCDRVGFVHGGYYDFDEVGALTLLPPYMTAALLAAGFAGLEVGKTLTNKALNVQGVEYNIEVPLESDDLDEGGVISIETSNNGFRVLHARSTWLVNRNFNRVEISNGAGYDFLARALREALNPIKGELVEPTTLASAAAIAESVCVGLSKPPTGNGSLLVGDAQSPPYRNITATGKGDAVYLSLQASVGIPNNFNLITIAAVPYSGTATA